MKSTRQYIFDLPAVDSSRSIDLIAIVDIYKTDPGDAYFGLYGTGSDPVDLFYSNGIAYMTSHSIIYTLRTVYR